MRLNNQQIEAMVAQERQDFEAKKKNAKSLIPNKVKREAAKYLSFLNKIPARVVEHLGYCSISNINEKKLISAIMDAEGLEIEPTKFDSTAYRNKILIASIDSSDLAELQAKIK